MSDKPEEILFTVANKPESNIQVVAYCGGNNQYTFEPTEYYLNPGNAGVMKVIVKERQPGDTLSLCFLEIPLSTSNYKDFAGKLVQVTVRVEISG